MPLYFAYGSNMDVAALRTRCPGARMLCTARLPRHRFAVMSSGYASVRRADRAVVHGVLFALALSDVGPLDRYEEVDGGLYVKAIQPVLRQDGHPVQALIYIGADDTDGVPKPGYMEAVVAAARAAALPDAYIAVLQGFCPGARRPS